MSGFLSSLFGRSKTAPKLREPVASPPRRPPAPPSAPAAPPPPIEAALADPQPMQDCAAREPHSESPAEPRIGPSDTSGGPSSPTGERLAASDQALSALNEAVKQNDLAETLRLGEALRDAYPDIAAAYVLPARALRDHNRADEAEALLAQAPDLTRGGPPDLLTMITRAELADRRRSFVELKERAQALQSAFPDFPLGSVLEAKAACALGDYALAEKLIGNARARFPGDLVVLINWTETAVKRCDWRYAELRAAETRHAFPSHHSGYNLGIAALRSAGRHVDADGLLAEAVDRLPGDIGIAAEWVRRAAATEDWATAAERSARLRDRFPAAPEGYVLGIRALRGMRDLDRAKGLVSEAVALSRRDPAVYFSWVEVALDSGDWPEVERAASLLREHYPEQWTGWFFEARALIEQQRSDQAEALVATGRKRLTPVKEIESLWIDLALSRKDWTEALTRADDARAMLPQEPEPVVRRVRALIGAGRIDEAAALAREAAERFPGNGVVQRLQEDAARASSQPPAPKPPSAAGAPRDEEISRALSEGRFGDAVDRWHALASDEHTPLDAVLEGALRVSLADPWNDRVRPLFEMLGSEHRTSAPGWRPMLEWAPALSVSPDQFHTWREASAAFLSEAPADSLDADTRARWTALVG